MKNEFVLFKTICGIRAFKVKNFFLLKWMRSSFFFDQRGFSVIEVIIAFSIATLVFISIAEVTATSARRANKNRMISQLTTLALSKLEELSKQKLAINEKKKGIFEKHPEVHWTARVLSVKSDDDAFQQILMLMGLKLPGAITFSKLSRLEVTVEREQRKVSLWLDQYRR